MRAILGGLLAFFLLAVASASAQITGQVEKIGFDGNYRPGCWTPMLVRLTSTGAPTDYYEIRVWQHDLDGDLPYYSTRISLTAGAGAQPFWTYFIPEPIHGGMTDQSSSAAELAQRLRITVHDKTGKELVQVPLSGQTGLATANTVDPPGGFDRERGARFVVFVGRAATPPLGHYEKSGIVGIKENLVWAKLEPDLLPENAIGYEGVDAVVWLDGDPAALSASGGRRFDALRDYVRRGGHLVLCTPPQWQQLAGFDDLMPVDITGTELNAQQSPVREMTDDMPYNGGQASVNERSPWDRYRTPFTIAVGIPRPGAVVDRYSERVNLAETAEQMTPWLVRKPYGFGCVSWIAQDLGQRELVDRGNWGWPVVWEEVLGAQSRPIVNPSRTDKARWAANGVVDVGYTVIERMNLSGRGAKLVGVTVLFFVAYWAAVGPGAFFWLRYKGRSTLNWFVFGLLALGATAITLGMVKLMLGGDAEMRHLSLVRVDGERRTPSSVTSLLGIYVPRDGAQRIEVAGAAGGSSSSLFAPSISPYPIHPQHHRHDKGDTYLYPAPRQYKVPVPAGDAEASDTAGVAADVPFRTTMKRLEAHWSGPMEDRVEGNARLTRSDRGLGYIAGSLTNLTGKDLRNIYIAFRHQMPEPGSPPSEWLMFVPAWQANSKLDLAAAFNPPGKQAADFSVGGEKRLGPNAEFPVRGMFRDWRSFFEMRTGGLGIQAHSDLKQSIPQSIPIISFFNRIPVQPTDADDRNRADLHRNGVRGWDMSGPLLAGRLCIVAQADDTELPMPLTVDGVPPAGLGMTIYQFVLPIDPIPLDPSTTTQPATNATSTP